MPAPWPEVVEENEAKRLRVSSETVKNLQCRRSIQSAGGLCWSASDLSLAANLLDTPNARFPSVTFSNLEEKRRVFTLIYDVLRYKSILNQALNDLYFFTRFPYLKERCHIVWLLFFDLYKRDFTMRDPLEPDVEAAFAKQCLYEIDEILWQLRVKLAATVSRLRIKNGAHSLSELLPKHLRLTRPALEENIITGWVNIFKTSLKDVGHCLMEFGIAPLSRDQELLEPLTYKTDHLLPRFIHVMPGLREDLVESQMVQNHHIIMQERTFCLGPAVIAQLLKNFALSGKVAQTHVNSPITMAYFANLLINNDKIEALLVFGAGYRKEACEQYLRELGVKNTQVFSESFAGLPAESRVLDNVIAVLATPPNTNSSVVDPVDLAVARGGDLQILQQLTDDDFASTPRGENINKFLIDQRDSLRRAMSKPQIQFVVYETHSRFHCENEDMVNALINDLNNYAAEVHLEELRRTQGETQEKERAQVETSDSQSEAPIIKVEEELSLPIPPPIQSVVIPPSDLFELADLPDLCPNFENCLDLVTEGTYIAVIKRKEITRLDPKYMIQMAEARGLFGRPEGTPKAKNAGQTARAKAALAALQARSDAMADKSKAKVKVEMDRIAAPTRASMLRDVHPPPSKDCPRHTHHLAHDGTPSYLSHLPEERKPFLTPEEEEELIRRLYTCPRVNLYPTKLYEDLPPLKFWNSPASVIESYLKRKVFQRRLQLAYEFNQTKEFCLSITDEIPQKAPDQLSKAMEQLTEDINYFECLASQDSLSKEEDLDRSVDQNEDYSQNKALWNRICPEKGIITAGENVDLALQERERQQKFNAKLLKDIKQRYFNYKDFYRLKNLRSREKKALVLTIGMPQDTSYNSLSTTASVSINESEIKSNTPKTKRVFVKSLSDPSLKQQLYQKESKIPFKRLPKIKYSSFDSINRQYITGLGQRKDSLLPQITSTFVERDRNLNRRGTTIGLRDSLELAQQRLSRVSKTLFPKQFKIQLSSTSLTSHKDIYRIRGSLETLNPISETSEEENINKSQICKLVSSDYTNRTLTDHQDSFLLAENRLNSKEKVNAEVLSCDICNNRDKTIQFTCHSHTFNTKPVRRERQSIVSGKSLLSHKDSIEINLKKIATKEKKLSVSCQVDDLFTCDDILQNTVDKSLKIVSGPKESEKSKTNYKLMRSKGINMSNSTFTKHIMQSMEINQIITEDNNNTFNYNTCK